MKAPRLMHLGIWATLIAFCTSTVQAATVDLATSPMVSGLSKVVAPNIYFILDDSGSMAWDYLPDEANNNNTKLCFDNFGYNKLAYNPAVIYQAPKTSTGSAYADSVYTAAYKDGFKTSSGTTNLSSTTTKTSTSTGTKTLDAQSYTTTNGSKTVIINHANHGFATNDDVSFPDFSNKIGGSKLDLGGGPYNITVTDANHYTISVGGRTNASKSETTNSGVSPQRVSYTITVTTTVPNTTYSVYTASPASPPSTCLADSAYTLAYPNTATEKTNYANWYTYYRTRILMAKTATSLAFATVNDKFRVGYSTISETGVSAASTKFLKFSKFDATQKSNWYSKLFSVTPTGSTPLRGALTKAGRIYAGKLLTGNDDPIQYSCQQNFTILTTDGYWNTGSETDAYTSAREDGVTDVGDVDGVTGTERPMLDSTKAPDTLADIAMYYYNTDLRTTSTPGGLIDDGVTRLDVSKNNVNATTTDPAKWQHMTTFTIGLGVSGVLAYDKDYLIPGHSADYTALIQGTKNWPDPLTNPLSTSTSVSARIDDLWHAAVNGRGKYLSAQDPQNLITSLQETLAKISAANGSAASAATSNLEPVAGDNFAYTAQYTTAEWYGDVQKKSVDVSTGAVSEASAWSARDLLDATVSAASDTRTIYTFSSSASNKLRTFTSANLGTEISRGYFKSSSSNPGGKLTQYDTWTSTQQAAATDAVLINYLRGQTAQEDTNLFRDRSHVLGDIVNAAPVYVQKAPFKYADSGYSSFASNQKTRGGTVYVGANDGMLHAFNTDTGAERWAYIPSAVIPNLYKLADTTYANNHQFYVDGSLTVGDIYDGSQWRTILVGGLGDGGKAYFALDITDPAAPKALWEFSTTEDSDLGYSYGNPIVTKRASDGKWVTLFASGYNNTTGDAKGRLYVLDALTGAKLSEIITSPTNTDANQSGIGKVTNYVLDTLVDNSTQYVYGGDLGGTLWRFDINAQTSQKLGSTAATAGNNPITAKPEVARVKDNSGNYYRVVFFGTGRYLGFNDLSASSTSATVPQLIFAVKDTGTDLGILTTAGATLVPQTLATNVSPRTIPNPQPVDWYSKNGWYVALPAGERVNIDLKLQLGTLVALSSIPVDDYCSVSGTSYLYALDYLTGTAITAQNGKYVGFEISAALGTGLSLVRLANGKLVAIITKANATIEPTAVPAAPAGGTGVRRVGWREIY